MPTYARVVFTFSRPVGINDVAKAFSIAPATDGDVESISGQTQYAFSPTKALTDLTTYTVALGPITDLSHHRMPGGRWTFTTNIVPRITSVTAPGGAALTDGSEMDPGTPITINFNDAMEPTTIRVDVGTTQVNLTWAADARSATMSTNAPAASRIASSTGGGITEPPSRVSVALALMIVRIPSSS